MKTLRSKLISLIAAFFVLGISTNVYAVISQTTTAAPGYQAPAQISFTFDDGLQSTYANAEPILAQNGLTATDYVITGCVGMTTTPNTCRANTAVPYMTWAQIQALQNTDGWEIGSHTVNHDCLASSAKQDPSDCQTNTLTSAQVVAELANSKLALQSEGINVSDFAPPYGDYNNAVLADIAKYYATMRQFKNASDNTNSWPYSDYYLWDYIVLQKTTPVASVEAAINQAITNHQWIILTMHSIVANPSTNPNNYQYGTAELSQIAQYVAAKQQAGLIKSVHISQGLATNSTNLLPDASFNSGIADGWSTDAPSTITADSKDNGSYPDPTNSVKLVSTSATTHLFSPQVSVDPNTTYLLKTFLNVQQITSGEVGFYIDEYDANGNWISGQWKAAETSAFVEDMNFAYTPSSAQVSRARLQIIVTGNPGITAYVDNAQWFPVSTVSATNLMLNGTFDQGIGDGWSTDDPTNIQANSANNGSPANPVNSVYLRSSTTPTNGHLFSPTISVNSTSSYNVTTWLNLKQITNTANGVVALYVDEYNSSGTWISGQYEVGVNTLGANNIGFSYTPSSSSVTQARLQVIVVGGAGIQAYFDDVRWYLAN